VRVLICVSSLTSVVLPVTIPIEKRAIVLAGATGHKPFFRAVISGASSWRDGHRRAIGRGSTDREGPDCPDREKDREKVAPRRDSGKRNRDH
jgi:hypothetical protein